MGEAYPKGGQEQVRAAAAFFGRWKFTRMCEAAEMFATSTSSLGGLQERGDGSERLAAAAEMGHVFRCLAWHLDPYPVPPDLLRMYREALDNQWAKPVAERALAAVRGIARTYESQAATEADFDAMLTASQRILRPFVGSEGIYQELSGLADEEVYWPTGGREDAGQRSFSDEGGPPPAGGAQMGDGRWADPDD